MELYAKGQLSFLILNCLLERDFYGLDFISEINNKSNGKIDLKKPSVYSNLTRMEKQGYVSSYLKSSELGPNRKYYSITDKGRNFYQELKEYFDRNNIDVFRDFNDSDNEIKNNTNTYSNNVQQVNSANDNIDSESENDDYFDFSSIDNTAQSKATMNSQSNTVFKETANKVDTNSYSIKSLFTSSEIKSNEQNDFVNKVQQTEEKQNENNQINEQKEEKKDDAVFIDSHAVEEYNRRLYDISKDFNKYKRKKSFSEDQISFAVDNSSPISEANERTKNNIEEFKNAFLDNKGKFTDQNNGYYDYSKQMSYRYNKSTQSYQDVLGQSNSKTEEQHDDGRFITSRIDNSQIGRAKKIEPPRLKVVSEQNKESNRMPPPKRDMSIDPSHKEILTRLYSKTKNGDDTQIREDALYDYNDLKDFYKDQNISFNVYKKPAEKTEHNTNKLYLMVSITCFFASCIISGLLFAILYSAGLTNNYTNFFYFLLPIFVLFDVGISFYNYRKYTSWVPAPMIPQWKMWLITFVICAFVIGLNFVCGMSPARFSEFATTTLLPIFITLLVLPFRYYFKRYMLIKYWI